MGRTKSDILDMSLGFRTGRLLSLYVDDGTRNESSDNSVSNEVNLKFSYGFM